MSGSRTRSPAPSRAAFAAVDTWVFDLDNTLYPHHVDLFAQIDKNMTAYVSALLGLSNLAAAILFAATGPVHWVAAVAMGIGCLAGGWAGPPIVARLPARPLRVVIGVAGLGLAVWLAVR